MRDDFAAWGNVEPVSAGMRWRWDEIQDKVAMFENADLNVLGMLCYGSWHDSSQSTKPRRIGRPEDQDKYPPRNLWPGDGEANYWQVYCESAMTRLPEVEYWEVWNEPNICSVYFGNPDAQYYGTRENPIDSPRERCSLYVRMCHVAKQTAGSDGPKIVAGAVGGMTSPDASVGLSAGVDWLQDMLEISEAEYGGWESCFDALSVHPYQEEKAQKFWGGQFEHDLDTVRAVMHAQGAGEMELWVTEIGWPLYYWDVSTHSWGQYPGVTPMSNADYLCRFYVSSIGSQVCEKGGYDRVFWYELSSHRDIPAHNDGFGLLDSTPEQKRMPTSYALEQLIRGLTGKRVVRRLPDSGSAGDSLVQVYEFENPDGGRLWVGWVNDSVVRQDVAVPVRSDVVVGESLAYRSGNPPEFSVRSGPDGWLRLELTERPVFVTEIGPRRRPDLVVDSVRVQPEEPRVGERMMIRAWVRNKASKETRATPKGMATKVLFVWEGDTLGYEETTRQIGVGKAVEVQFPVVEVGPELAGPALVKVVANPEQRYVELDMDNNDGYLKTEVRWAFLRR